MIPIGPLMWEHRLIEKMITLLEKECTTIKESGTVNTHFIVTSVDFFQTYADRTHHGKEEDILFQALSKKNLTAEHKKIMERLIADHAKARAIVQALSAANQRVIHSDLSATQDIVTNIEKLVELYPPHIRVEDKDFFFPCMTYFSKGELQHMLQAFWEFDSKMIHEKYTKLVQDLEGSKEPRKE